MGIPGKLLPIKSIWLRIVYMPLYNGDTAVLLYNRGLRKKKGNFRFNDINLIFSKVSIRDLYEHK